MDKWIYAACQSLIQYVSDELAAYRLYTVVPRLVNFLEELTNWHAARMGRDFWQPGNTLARGNRRLTGHFSTLKKITSVDTCRSVDECVSSLLTGMSASIVTGCAGAKGRRQLRPASERSTT